MLTKHRVSRQPTTVSNYTPLLWWPGCSPGPYLLAFIAAVGGFIIIASSVSFGTGVFTRGSDFAMSIVPVAITHVLGLIRCLTTRSCLSAPHQREIPVTSRPSCHVMKQDPHCASGFPMSFPANIRRHGRVTWDKNGVLPIDIGTHTCAGVDPNSSACRFIEVLVRAVWLADGLCTLYTNEA